MSDIIQGSPEWYKAKNGKVGASRISDIMATTKSGPSASRKNYMAELVVARLTGNYPESYTSPAMQWGIDNEPLARQAYEERMFVEVQTVGFVLVPGMDAGASPDGLVGDDGLIEIKCPNTATHIDTLLTGKIDRKYILQMQFQMFVTGRAWCDYVSFDPRLPDNLCYYRQRVMRDDALIDEIVTEVNKFLHELDEMERRLREVA